MEKLTSLLKNWKFKVKRSFTKAIKTQSSPSTIAWGFAVGSFIAILPTPGISIGIGIVLALIFKKLHKISLFMAMLIWNPFTIYPLYFFSFQLGNWFLGYSTQAGADLSVYQIITQFTLRFMTGNVVVAGVFATFSYLVLYHLVVKYRQIKSKKFSKSTQA